jgi:hypothetical protein
MMPFSHSGCALSLDQALEYQPAGSELSFQQALGSRDSP